MFFCHLLPWFRFHFLQLSRIFLCHLLSCLMFHFLLLCTMFLYHMLPCLIFQFLFLCRMFLCHLLSCFKFQFLLVCSFFQFMCRVFSAGCPTVGLLKPSLVRQTSTKFGLHVGNTKFITQSALFYISLAIKTQIAENRKRLWRNAFRDPWLGCRYFSIFLQNEIVT